MKRFITIICLLASLHFIYATRPGYDILLDDIEKAVSAQDWAKADSLTKAAIDLDPSDPNCVLLLSNLGMIRFYNGDDSLALEALDEAHRMAPNSVTVLANRARVLTATGRQALAIADYDNIERLDSTYSDTYLYRGLIKLYGGAFESAEEDFNKLKQLAPDSEETLIALASLYSITSRPELAIENYSLLIKATPSAEYYAARALAELELNRDIDAAEDIASGLALEPDYSELYLARAILNRRRFEFDASRADATQAIALGANPARVDAILGNSQQKR